MSFDQAIWDEASLTQEGASYLERLVKELDVPEARYEQAESRYQSVGKWLCRPESTLKDMNPDVYVQGSFRLGTPIRPVNDHEDYDIDLVCELLGSKSSLTQQQLKTLLGEEMKLYAKAHGMSEAGESRRCWTLDYADGAQFHLDALPAIPDGGERQRLLVEEKLNPEWSTTAIAITDFDHEQYSVISRSWPHSNPRGYTEWFRARMKENFDQIREAMAFEARASVEDIPSYRVKTPLQQAVQVLKRHRDVMFADDPEHKPISVILTTLSGLAYRGEDTVAKAVGGILSRMGSYIELDQNGDAYIANPTDPQENFADRWILVPEKRESFYAWLKEARKVFEAIAKERNQDRILEAAMESFGAREATAASSGSRTRSALTRFVQRNAAILFAPHKKVAQWPASAAGWAAIHKVTWTGRGFSRPKRIKSGAHSLVKGSTIRFEASSNVEYPYDIWWQITNTGGEALAAGGLRGDFYFGETVRRGHPTRTEPIGYSGTHSAQCFIVKNGHLVAKSEVFIVMVG